MLGAIQKVLTQRYLSINNIQIIPDEEMPNIEQQAVVAYRLARAAIRECMSDLLIVKTSWKELNLSSQILLKKSVNEGKFYIKTNYPYLKFLALKYELDDSLVVWLCSNVLSSQKGYNKEKKQEYYKTTIVCLKY